MVKFALKLSAELSGVTELQPIDIPDSPFQWTFIVECTKCREVHGKPIIINRFETSEITGSKGEANFVFRCKGCKSEHSANIERSKDVYELENSGKPVTLLTIDARGLDFNEFHANDEFACKGAESTTRFTDVDLSEGEWYDYDDNAGAEVSITDVVWTINRI